MTRKPTLLAHLTGKFSYHPELVATAALGHVLASSEPAKEALRGVLRACGLDIGTIIPGTRVNARIWSALTKQVGNGF